MKFNPFPILSVLLVIALFSCEDDMMNADDCNLSDLNCTEKFRIITVEITNEKGEAVILDEYYTFIDSRNKIDTLQHEGLGDGIYPVATDSQREEFEGEAKSVIFVGVKNGKNLVEHEMVLKSDCCHIELIGGETKITIK